MSRIEIRLLISPFFFPRSLAQFEWTPLEFSAYCSSIAEESVLLPLFLFPFTPLTPLVPFTYPCFPQVQLRTPSHSPRPPFFLSSCSTRSHSRLHPRHQCLPLSPHRLLPPVASFLPLLPDLLPSVPPPPRLSGGREEGFITAPTVQAGGCGGEGGSRQAERGRGDPGGGEEDV